MTSTLIAGATALICLFLLWSQASRGSASSAFFAVLMLSFVGIVWLAAAVAGLLLYRSWQMSLISPLLVALTFITAWTGAPAELGWVVSKSALERTALTCATSTETRLVGVYRVSKVAKGSGGCLIYQGEAFLTFAYTGFAYFPDNPPKDNSRFSYQPHAGSWYRFSERY
ncbi:hypothetical protein [Nocardia sp. NPDC057668]|uniref:hypothetical protein n=1 Tax=Nocardia sp. NPDC057668 TaxID=3346202 RepID=UPI00366EE8DD